MRAVTPVLTALFFLFFTFRIRTARCFLVSTAPPPESATSSTGDSGRRITLDVVVTDKSGKPEPGLQPQDFTVLDDKRPRKILFFSATDKTGEATGSPQQVILLVDAVNNSFDGVGYERLQLDKFLRQDGGRLPNPTSLVLLTDTSQGQSVIYSRWRRLDERSEFQ
jgi:hypothetical protein